MAHPPLNRVRQYVRRRREEILVPQAPPVQGPIVEAGGPYSGYRGDPITLNGSITAGDFPLAAPLTWSIVSGGTGTFLPSPNVIGATFTPDSSGQYVIKLQQFDTEGNSGQDTATLVSSSLIFDLPLTNSLVPTSAAGSDVATFTRNSEAYVKDFEGILRRCVANEARFQGARRVENFIKDSENIPVGINPPDSTYWQVSGSDIEGGQADPFGGTKAYKFIKRSPTVVSVIQALATYPSTGAQKSRGSVWLRCEVGTLTAQIIPNILAGSDGRDVPIDTTWRRFEVYGESDPILTNGLQIRGTNNVSDPIGTTWYMAFPSQVCGDDLVQDAPDEYVARGGDAPAIDNGAGADGVQYFPYENASTTNPVTFEITTTQGPAIPEATLFGCVSERGGTNLCLQSEALGTAPWTTSTGSVTVDGLVAPDETSTADSFIPNTNNVVHQIYQGGISITDAVEYAISFYAKADGYDFIQIAPWTALSSGYATFDLVNGTVTQQDIVDSASIIDEGNGWYRCSVIATSISTTAAGFSVVSVPDGTSGASPAFAADGVSGTGLWGMQVEAYTSPSTYIKTEAGTASRAADVLTYSETGNIVNATGYLSCDLSTFGEESVYVRQLIGRNSAQGPVIFADILPAKINTLDGSFNNAESPTGTSAYLSVQGAAFSWGANLTAYWNGAAGTPVAYGGNWGSGAIRMGARPAGDQLQGTIKNVLIYNEENPA